MIESNLDHAHIRLKNAHHKTLRGTVRLRMNDRLSCNELTLRAWLINYVTSVVNRPSAGVPTDQPFDSYGFDSVEVVLMAGVLEEELGTQVDAALLFQHPSIDAFCKGVFTPGRHLMHASAATITTIDIGM